MASLAQIVRRIEGQAARVQLSALKRGEGELKQRIFNRGEASDNSKLGPYRSKSYKALRVRRGRQVRNKDLMFDGTLARSIVTGTQDGKAVLGIITNKQRLIAEGQEGQVGKEIFRLSDQERKLVFETVRAEIIAILKNAR